jgi:hypothetical protein
MKPPAQPSRPQHQFEKQFVPRKRNPRQRVEAVVRRDPMEEWWCLALTAYSTRLNPPLRRHEPLPKPPLRRAPSRPAPRIAPPRDFPERMVPPFRVLPSLPGAPQLDPKKHYPVPEIYIVGAMDSLARRWNSETVNEPQMRTPQDRSSKFATSPRRNNFPRTNMQTEVGCRAQSCI